MNNISMRGIAAGVSAAILVAVFPLEAEAFVWSFGHSADVEGASITFHVDVPGLAPSGISWNQAFEEAAYDWSVSSVVQINTVRDFKNPCGALYDGYGGIGFSGDLCGKAHLYTSNTRAISIVQRRDVNTIIYSDIPYTTAFDWDIYDGDYKVKPIILPDGKPFNEVISDFRRTSKHEIGHALGLGHSKFPRSIVSDAKDRHFDVTGLSPDDICGVNIANGRHDACTLLLPHSATLTGEPTSAIFTGGASKTFGASYQAHFSSNDMIDVMGTVVVEEAHYGLNGRLHAIVVLSDGTNLAWGSRGFVAWNGTVAGLHAVADVQTLDGANELYILKNFSIGESGISGVGVSIFIGYSLESEPDEVYYSGTPIVFNLE